MAILGQRLCTLVGATLVAALGAAGPAAAQSAPAGEDSIKAAYLYNFGKYIDWPDAAFQRGAFHVCVVADPAFVKSVDAIVTGETLAGHPVTRESPSTAEAARQCNILFFGRGESERVDRLLAAVKGAHVLTVGETPDFLSRGGVVAFVREGDRVRFDVDVAEAQRAGLTVSSRLLRVARRVSPAAPVR